MNLKYNEENVKPYCEGKVTITDVLKEMNCWASNKRLREIIKKILIEQGSYLGTASYKVKGVKPRKSEDEYFTNNITKRTTYSVRQSLFKRGLKERVCECCGLSEWIGNKIPLEVHHKDGNKYNNLLINLEILCPNCHYFTDTYKTKNRGVAKLAETR